MMKYKVGLILILFLIFIACEKEKNPTSSSPTFSFQSFHSGCKGGLGKIVETSGNGKIILSSFNDTIRVVHVNAYYNCCAEIRMDIVKAENGFDLFEKDEGETCRCMCYSDVTGFIYNLFAGTYLIKVFDTTDNLVGQGYVIVRPKKQDGLKG